MMCSIPSLYCNIALFLLMLPVYCVIYIYREREREIRCIASLFLVNIIDCQSIPINVYLYAISCFCSSGESIIILYIYYIKTNIHNFNIALIIPMCVCVFICYQLLLLLVEAVSGGQEAEAQAAYRSYYDTYYTVPRHSTI